MRIVVFGSTGVLGRQVIPRLLERGHQVRAVARRPEKATRWQHLGVETVRGDILDAATVDSAVRGCDVALHIATAIPHADGESDWDLNDRIRRDGTRNLLAACERAGCRRYIQQSIAFMCGDSGGAPADESRPLEGSSFLQSALDMEALVQASSLDWCMLRGGLFYGADTFEDDWRKSAAQGTLMLPGDGMHRLSLVHQVDMARAVVLASESARPRTIYHVADDEPVSYRVLFGHIAALCGGPVPATGGEMFLPPCAASNKRIKAELGWMPAFATYRSGML